MKNENMLDTYPAAVCRSNILSLFGQGNVLFIREKSWKLSQRILKSDVCGNGDYVSPLIFVIFGQFNINNLFFSRETHAGSGLGLEFCQAQPQQ